MQGKRIDTMVCTVVCIREVVAIIRAGLKVEADIMYLYLKVWVSQYNEVVFFS